MVGWSPPAASETKGPSVATVEEFPLSFPSFAELLRNLARSRQEEKRKAVLAQLTLTRRIRQHKLEYLKLLAQAENIALESLIQRAHLEYAMGLAQYTELCGKLLEAQSLLERLATEKDELAAACLHLASLRDKFLQLALKLLETEGDTAPDQVLDCATNAEVAAEHADSLAQRCLGAAEKAAEMLFLSFLRLSTAPKNGPWFLEKKLKYKAHWESFNTILVQVLVEAINLTRKCQTIEVECMYIRGRILPHQEDEEETARISVPPGVQQNKQQESLRRLSCCCCEEETPKSNGGQSEDGNSTVAKAEEPQQVRESKKRSVNKSNEEGDERTTKRISRRA